MKKVLFAMLSVMYWFVVIWKGIDFVMPYFQRTKFLWWYVSEDRSAMGVILAVSILTMAVLVYCFAWIMLRKLVLKERIEDTMNRIIGIITSAFKNVRGKNKDVVKKKDDVIYL